MPKKIPELSKAQIGRIRANMGRSASQLANRLAAYAMDEDDKVKMTATQVNAAKVVLGHVLPAMQSTEITEVQTDNKTKAEHEQAYKAAIDAIKASLKPEDIKTTLAAMDKDTRQALIDSIEHTSQ